MIMRNFQTVLRDMKKNKLFTVINISGLAVGMACAMLIFLWVEFELSHDDFHLNKNEIYKVSYKNESYTGPGPLASYLKKEFPEIKEATPFLHRGNCKMTQNNKGYFSQGSYVDQSFFDIFSFPLIKGNSKTLLTDPNSIVITQKLAKRIFGTDDPIGKVILLDDGYLERTESMTITGILKDIPVNTHFKVTGENKFEFLIPFKRIDKWVQNNWKVNMVETYVLLNTGVNKKIIDQKIAGVVTKQNPKVKIDLSLVPLKNCYLYNIDGGGRFQNIYLFSFVALFILMIAGINYINLSTVRSEKWSKQIAVKKILGASKRILVKQFLIESVFFTYISMLVALILTIILLPTLNRLFNSNLQLQYFSFHLIIIILLPLFIGLLAGIYPAFILSSTKPLNILGSNFRGNKNKQGEFFRNGLIIFQFALSVIMVIFGSIIYLQNQHFNKQDLGYEKENLLVVDMAGDLIKSYNIVKEELLKIPEVKGVSCTNNPITHRWWTVDGLKWDNQAEGQNINFGFDMVGYDLDKVMGIKMLKGRFLSREFSTDATKGIVINEAAVKEMNLINPIGSIIRNLGGQTFEIIGVMNDFHTESLHEEIKPHLYVLGKNAGYHMYLSLNPGNTGMSELLTKVGEKIKGIVPTDPFSYHFLDSELNTLYNSEKITGILINFSTIIILIISCLGLIGLAFYTTRQRIKEISIRKVLGGSVTGIVIHLTKNIIKLVLIANIIAWPIAWLVANNWLQNYAYKINPEFGTFLLAGIFSFSIALLTVSYQTLKAANINPAECLKRV